MELANQNHSGIFMLEPGQEESLENIELFILFEMIKLTFYKPGIIINTLLP